MKTFTKFLILVTILIMFYSCKDISDLGNNTVKIPILPAISKEDSLNYLGLSAIDFGDVRWHRVANQNIIVNNNSSNYTIIIYSIKIKNNLGFELYPQNGFPIVILPLQNNADNQLIAKWNTNIITPGIYQDTVYLNESQKIIFTMKGNVTN